MSRNKLVVSIMQLVVGVIFTLLLSTYYVLPVYATANFDQINQKVCDRFEEDLNKLAAIMDEYKRRKGILETRVAFGGIDTPVENADYQITYAAEALAFQRAQKSNSINSLKGNLQVLAGKILKAKSEVKKVL